MRQICIHDDSNNAIILTPDHYKGVVVQVIRYAPTLEPSTENGGLVEHRRQHVIYSKAVTALDDPQNLTIVENKRFRDSIQTAIGEAKTYLAKIIGLDQMIDGVLDDYESQNKDLNSDRPDS